MFADDLAVGDGWAPSCARREEAQGEGVARVRVPAPLGAGNRKYSYCLIVPVTITTVYIAKIR